MKILKLSMQEAEAYSEHSQTSKTGFFFAKIVWEPLNIFLKSSSLDVWLGSQQVSEKLFLKKQFQKIISITMV